MATYFLGAASAIVPAYLVARWQRDAAIGAERREATRRRRESRIEPVLSLLRMTQASAGADSGMEVLLGVLERARGAGNQEVWEMTKREIEQALEEQASLRHVVEEGTKADLAAPSQRIASTILEILDAAASDEDDRLDRLYEKIQRLEALVDEYLEATDTAA